MKYFGVMEGNTSFIHPTAVIDDGAQVGKGTRIWHFCHLMPGCTVGEDCNIGQNVFIDRNVIIGDAVKIQNNVSLYSGVIIEDGVFIGPSAIFTNVINPRSFIERKNEFKKTIVRRGATIGANATIVCDVEIGSYAMIGAGAVVSKSVSPYALMIGNPAQRIGWVSESGHTLKFNDAGKAVCPQTGDQYQLKDDVVNRIS
jgi:UDP-2-acetamido-3-amino-2,3-dideoxy-glucuronate N-acetyltransferase